MKIYRFNQIQARQIDQHGSRGATFIPIIRQADGLSVVSIHLDPLGILGLHPAAADQLFLVTAGEGWVSTSDLDELAIKSGMGALWRKEEMHQTRAGNLGLTAIVIEGEGLAGSIDFSLAERIPQDSA